MSKDLFGTVALLGGAALGADYLISGDNSIIGKFLNAAGMGAPKHVEPPSDPLYGRPKFGEPSTSEWEVPVKTMRAPFPLGDPDASGAIEIPFHSAPVPHDKKNKKPKQEKAKPASK